MIKFSINRSIYDYCFIEDDEINNAEFYEDVAVVKVNVQLFEGESYQTYSIVQRFVDDDSKEIKYRLGVSFSALAKDNIVNSIVRVGNHFVFEIGKTNFDKTKSWTEYLQVDYVEQDGIKKFIERSKLPGEPLYVNDKVLIVKPFDRGTECLFSLEKSDIQTMEFTSIDNIDGETFLVTDKVSLEEDKDINERLMFKIDANGKRISPVYVRSKRVFIEEDLKQPYLLIKEQKINELREDYVSEVTANKALRRG